ncbi:hypothetical protein AB1Y20_000592 [Prymnesium parvum]|uniref:Dynein assembly factor 1, axonemal homolog n=1 Tax=Prymnesium parvum TaxID=97485 RepID=A0AB34K9Z8_PRYPA
MAASGLVTHADEEDPLDFDQAELLKALEEEEASSNAEKAPLKPARLTLQMIAERCIDPKELPTLSADALADRMLTIQRLRLDRLRLGSMEGLDVCNAATHLHLQHNLITTIEGLDFFDRLQYLVVAHNHLAQLEGLKHLATLQYLDASHNKIVAVAWKRDLPPSLMAVELQGNPCANQSGYRKSALASLPSLMVLDEERATIKELIAAGRPGLPHEEYEDEEDEESEEGEDEEGEDEEGGGEEGQAEEGEEAGNEEVGMEVQSEMADELYSTVGYQSNADLPSFADTEALYSMAMSAHGADDNSEIFKSKVNAARERVVERVAAQRCLQESKDNSTK